MNRKENILPKAFLIVLFILNTCAAAPKYVIDSTKCDVRVEEVIKILGKDLITLKNVFPEYVVKDTIMDDEDVRWKAKVCYKNNEKMFIAEANWVDSVHVHRLTIISPKISTKNLVRVGRSLQEISGFVSRDILPSPDGYFGLADKSDKRIHYFFNIEKYKKHLEVFDTYSKVPKDIVIEYIVLMKTIK